MPWPPFSIIDGASCVLSRGMLFFVRSLFSPTPPSNLTDQLESCLAISIYRRAAYSSYTTSTRSTRAKSIFTIFSLLRTSQSSPPSPYPPLSYCDAFCAEVHYACIGGPISAELARLKCALLTAIDWRLACARMLPQLYYVNLVAHSSCRFYTLSPSPNSSASSTVAAPTTTTPSPSTTARAANTDNLFSTSSTEETPGSNPGTSPDEIAFDSPDRAGSGGGRVWWQQRKHGCGIPGSHRCRRVPAAFIWRTWDRRACAER
jgi:hypothetical protein